MLVNKQDRYLKGTQLVNVLTKLKYVKKWVRGLGFSDIFVVPSPTKFKKQHYMEVIVEGHLKEVDNIIFTAKMPNLYWHFFQCALTHILLLLMSWTAIKMPNGCRVQENTCFCSTRLTLYKVTERDPVQNQGSQYHGN